MRTCIIGIIFAFSFSVTHSQTFRVSFSGVDAKTSTPVTLDSVRVENLTTLKDTLLRSPFVIDLGGTTGISDVSPAVPEGISISGNFANPFTSDTRFQVTSRNGGLVQLSLYSISGKLEASAAFDIEDGELEFRLSAGAVPSGVYILTVRGAVGEKSVRVVKSGSGGSGEASFGYAGKVSASTSSMTKTSSGNYRFVGYSKECLPDTILAAPQTDTAFVFHLNSIFKDANGTINITELGVESRYVQTAYGINNQITNEQYSARVSTLGTQLLSITDSAGVLRGLTLSLASANTANILHADAQSTAYGLLFLTPGITTTKPDSTTARMSKLKKMTTFNTLVEHLKLSLKSMDLKSIIDDSVTRNILEKCICEYAGIDSAIIPKFRNSTDPDPDPYFQVIQKNNQVEIKNFNWRWVNVYRRDLRGDGTQAAVTPISNPMLGGVPYSWGCALTQTCLNPSSMFDNSYSSIGKDVYKSEYWVVGVGLGESIVPHSTISSDIDNTLIGTAFTYFVLPTIDILLGAGGKLSNTNDIMLRAISICTKMQGDPDVNEASRQVALSTEISLLQNFGRLILKETAALTIQSGTGILIQEGLISTTVGGILYGLMSSIGEAIFGSNLIIWYKLLAFDTPRYSKYAVFSTRPVLRLPENGNEVSTTEPDLACYPVIGADKYSYQISDDQSFGSTIVNAISVSSQYTVKPGVLIDNKKYYWRMNASISGQESYWSSTWSFTTPKRDSTTVTDHDGNVYRTVAIGNQVWMQDNLKTTRYRNGEAIPNVTDSLKWRSLSSDAYCNYNNNEELTKVYGRLYNYYSVMDNREISPIGWHVATDSDYIKLAEYLGGLSIAGGKMKERGLNHWNPNLYGTNESGFTALPSGVRDSDGHFMSMTSQAWFWSIRINLDNQPYVLFSNGAFLSGQYSANYKYGFAVRCVKN